MRGEGRAAVPAGGRGPYPFCRKEKGSAQDPGAPWGARGLGRVCVFSWGKVFGKFFALFCYAAAAALTSLLWKKMAIMAAMMLEQHRKPKATL